MTHAEIIERICKGAELPTRRSGELAARAVLETLAERVDAAAAEQVAKELPIETGVYLQDVPTQRTFDLDAFYDRIAGRLAVMRPDAVRISQTVVSTISQAVGEETIHALRAQLPAAWGTLFEARPLRRAPPPIV
jgi:uncharacterized protein (DUF2267 family)